MRKLAALFCLSLAVVTDHARAECHYIMDCRTEFERSEAFAEMKRAGKRVVLVEEYFADESVTVGSRRFSHTETLNAGDPGAPVVTVRLSGFVYASGYIGGKGGERKIEEEEPLVLPEIPSRGEPSVQGADPACLLPAAPAPTVSHGSTKSRAPKSEAGFVPDDEHAAVLSDAVAEPLTKIISLFQDGRWSFVNRKTSLKEIARLAKYLLEHPRTKITLVGHVGFSTNGIRAVRGTGERVWRFNMGRYTVGELMLRRADVVAKELAAFGVKPSRIHPPERGTAEIDPKNRIVEVKYD